MSAKNAFKLVDQRPTKWVYELAEPVTQRYLPHAYPSEVWADRQVSKVVVSIGRGGDSAIFPATEDGEILDFDALHTAGYWITNPAEFMREWLAGATS